MNDRMSDMDALVEVAAAAYFESAPEGCSGYEFVSKRIKDRARPRITAALLAVGLPALLERVEAAEGMLERTEAQIHEDGGFIDQTVNQEQEISELRHDRDALAAKVARVEAAICRCSHFPADGAYHSVPCPLFGSDHPAAALDASETP